MTSQAPDSTKACLSWSSYIKSIPHRFADFWLTKVTKNRASVVYFIGEGHKKSVLIDQIEVFNVALLAGVPIFFLLTARRIDDRVRAGAHDICNSIAEAVTNIRQAWLATLILNSVV